MYFLFLLSFITNNIYYIYTGIYNKIEYTSQISTEPKLTPFNIASRSNWARNLKFWYKKAKSWISAPNNKGL